LYRKEGIRNCWSTLAVVIGSFGSSMATLAEPPDCKDSNQESRGVTPQRARFLIIVKVNEGNAAPLSVLLNWASESATS
jgi:hypothetical protein